MKFVLCNDIHLSHRGPQSRLDDWQETIFGKLEQVAKVAVKVKARAVCIAGDVFHQKSRIAYGTVLRLMRWAFELRRQGIEVLFIPGNHDLVHERVDSLDSQPLGLLKWSGAFTDVSFAPHLLLSRPEEDETPPIAVVGVPYPDAMQPDLEPFRRAAVATFHAMESMPWKTTGGSILMAHCFATPEGGTSFGHHVHRYSDLLDLPFDVFHFGHDHSDHGVAQAETGQFFVNLGALSRGTLAQDDLTRDVKIAVVEFGETITVKQIKLKVAPVTEIFDLALKAQKDRERTQVEAFVGQLSTDLALAGPVSFSERLGTLNLSDTVRARVQQYLDAAETARLEL